MPETFDVQAAGDRVDALLADLGGLAGASATAEELVRTLVGLYGAGLERVMEIVTETGAAEALHRLTADDLVSGLLIVHDLHPLTTAERVQAALDGVGPQLKAKNRGVELLDVAEDVVRLRLTGHGCSSAQVMDTVEGAIATAAPEISAVEVETARPLLQIGPRPPGPDPALDASAR
ncbi:MAG: NifU family protein [Actinoallomurus sp.]